MTYIWLGIAILLGITEAATMQLVSIWFAGGALAATVTGILGFPEIWQIVTFIVVSAILLIATRPMVKKLMKKGTLKTNVNSFVGKKVILTEKADNLHSSGKAKINGVDWTVRCDDDDVIEKGETVTVKRVEGVKLIVSK